MIEYTQAYTNGPEDIGPVPYGLTPVGPDTPGMVPVGTGVLQPRFLRTGQNQAAQATVPQLHAQYQQRVDESVNVARPQLVPGLRGKAISRAAYPDYLTEIPIGPIYETNGGYPWTYLPQRVKAFRATQPVLSVYQNGRYIKDYKFKRRPIQEMSTSRCY